MNNTPSLKEYPTHDYIYKLLQNLKDLVRSCEVTQSITYAKQFNINIVCNIGCRWLTAESVQVAVLLWAARIYMIEYIHVFIIVVTNQYCD